MDSTPGRRPPRVQTAAVVLAQPEHLGGRHWNNGLPDGFLAIVDLELDGQPAIVVVYDGKVRTQRHSDGSTVWDVPVPGGRGGPPTVADFDGDGLPEIGVAGGSTANPMVAPIRA